MDKDQKIFPIAVIGGGAAGTMAVLRCVLNNDETLFFPGSPQDKRRSRGFWVSKVENMPGHLDYKKGIENPNRESLLFLEKGEFQEKFHWKKNTGIQTIEREGDLFKLIDSKEQVYWVENVILCTGVMDVQPKIQGDIAPILPFANVQLADYCLRCDGHHIYQKETGIIGHDSGAAWVAIMLVERYAPPSMTIFTNGETADFDSETKELIELYGIKVEDLPIKTILGNAKEKKLEGLVLDNDETFNLGIAFISLGMIVYNDLVKDIVDCDERGFIQANGKGETSVQGLYVAGDLRAKTKKQIYTAWDTAVDAADDINAKLRRKKRNKLLQQRREK